VACTDRKSTSAARDSKGRDDSTFNEWDTESTQCVRYVRWIEFQKHAFAGVKSGATYSWRLDISKVQFGDITSRLHAAFQRSVAGIHIVYTHIHVQSSDDLTSKLNFISPPWQLNSLSISTVGH
jgi:hypothetical protein